MAKVSGDYDPENGKNHVEDKDDVENKDPLGPLGVEVTASNTAGLYLELDETFTWFFFCLYLCDVSRFPKLYFNICKRTL